MKGLEKKAPRERSFHLYAGGEERVIIFSKTAIGTAGVLAERLRAEIQQHFADSAHGITVSIGVACLRQPDVSTASGLVHLADKAMYKAKHNGKNRVEINT